MTLVRFYLYRQSLIIPTVSRVEGGLYVDSSPVTIIDTNSDELRRALQDMLTQSNPEIAAPVEDEPGSVILEILNLKKWALFEVEAIMYTLYLHESHADLYATARGADKMWRYEPARQKTFGKEEFDNIVDFIASELATDQNQLEADKARKTGGLMLLPPPSAPSAQE